MGSFSGMNWSNVSVIFTVVTISMIIVFFMSKPIGAYQMGRVICKKYGSKY